MTHVAVNFPHTFAERMMPLPADLGTPHAQGAAAFLASEGYVVEAGLTPDLLNAAQHMAKDPLVREYCPKDETDSRFQDETSAARWVAKNGGRAMFGLGRVLGDGGREWVGYGWTGIEPCDQLPDNPTTFALRLGESGRGQGLAVPFTTLIVAGSTALYGARDIGLETWASNGAAVEKYERAGFEHVTSVPDQHRPTLQAVGAMVNGHEVYLGDNGRHMVQDTRLYMAYPDHMLAPAA